MTNSGMDGNRLPGGMSGVEGMLGDHAGRLTTFRKVEAELGQFLFDHGSFHHDQITAGYPVNGIALSLHRAEFAGERRRHAVQE